MLSLKFQVQVGSKPRNYIACQTPLDGNQMEFWQMIWNENVNIIVLLTQETVP